VCAGMSSIWVMLLGAPDSIAWHIRRVAHGQQGELTRGTAPDARIN